MNFQTGRRTKQGGEEDLVIALGREGAQVLVCRFDHCRLSSHRDWCGYQDDALDDSDRIGDGHVWLEGGERSTKGLQ